MSRPGIDDAAHAVIDGWRGARPVVALMGEFSAGKSTLLNFLLEADLAPTKVTATHMPPTWFTASDTPFTVGLTRDGTLEDVDLDREDVDFRADYLMIHRGVDAPLLADCDLIDAPGISDPDLHKDALRFLQRYLDFVIWCTSASQAWRQTEKAAFEKLARGTQEHSVLTITRFDKLRNDKDRAKVLRRVETEAGPLFAHVVPLQTPKAAAVAHEDRTDAETGAWVATGGHGFMAALAASLAATTPKGAQPRKAAPKAKPASKAASESASKPDAKKAAPEPAPKPAETAPKASVTVAETPSDADPIAATSRALENIKAMPQNGQYSNQINHLLDTIICQTDLTVSNTKALFECSRIESDDMEIERLISQIALEFEAFGTGEPIRLDAG